MDANGNNFFNTFNKIRNRRPNNSDTKDNHKFLSQNINYFLGKQNSHMSNEEEKKENKIIPNIVLNRNSYSTSVNNQRNNNKNEKNKIFIRPAINIDRKTINNKINKDFQMNNNLNANSFIRKESKYYFIYLL